ncbi:uncharacterized protein LOC132578065 [Heteronotia binoei]|uniref:uncharacterized protein LOC132578065 n=1 Tax=Heteronotia binoei TaxID=13085 RepID=UPI00292EE30E|nr:uncharacterized protein LOC132578065 [Heteronotia binoei]
MKMPRLLRWILAALLVVVPAALAAIEAPLPNLESGARRRFCPGCYSSILQGENQPQPSPSLESIMALLESIKRQTSLEDSVLEIPSLQAERRRPQTPCVGCFEPLDTSKGEPPQGDLGPLQLYSTTVPLRRRRNKTRIYRTGSLSVLSRTATTDLSILLDELKRNTSHPERGTVSTQDPCLGCCGILRPDHPGSRENQPSTGDSGYTPTTAVPRRNGTMGDFRPGAYTPMRRMRMTGFFSGTAWTHPREDSPTRDRCQGCCGVNATAGAKPPGRREEGKGSSNKPTSGGSPSKGAWTPVLNGKDPNQHSSQTEEDERWPVFSGGAVPPWQNHPGR